MARDSRRSAADEVLKALESDTALIEHYDAAEIGELPLEKVTSRLIELGYAASLPDNIRKRIFLSASHPAAAVLDLLEALEPNAKDIGEWPISNVVSELKRMGIDFVAGLAKLGAMLAEDKARELTGVMRRWRARDRTKRSRPDEHLEAERPSDSRNLATAHPALVSMRQTDDENKAVNPDERDLIVAYLSYALDDTRAVSDTGLHLLQMTIAALRKEAAGQNANEEAPIFTTH